MNIRIIMDYLIDRTFDVLREVYNNQSEGKGEFSSNCGSRIIFPQYRTKEQGETPKTRVSEQELRFVFVEQFNIIAEKENLYYSVETPTKGTYSFSNKEKPCADEDGRSGEFDMTIFNQMGKRVCLIEFKAHNVEEQNFEKDFVKLRNIEKEECEDAYFVLLLEVCNKETIKSIHKKLAKISIGNTCFKCFSFADNEYFGDITSKILDYKE